MSIDLDWTKLDESLSASLVDILNTHLQAAAASQPSFIGPIQITSFDFGSQPPDIELVDLRNIYRDFLDDDSDDEESSSSSSPSPSRDPVKVTQHSSGALDEDDDDGFEWVSRRAAAKMTAMQDEYHYHHLPPHVRYGRGPSSPSEVFSLAPAHTDPYAASAAWSTGPTGLAMSMPSLPPRPFVGRTMSALGTPLVGTPGIGMSMGMGMGMGLGMGMGTALPSRSQSLHTPSPIIPTPSSHSPQPTPPSASALPSSVPPEPAGGSEQPDLQIHLHMTWPSNLRLTLTTSLRINYPSPMFMSLPIKLSVTGLLFTGEVAVAYEGSRRRVHLCILDDQDPYGPAVGRPKRDKEGEAGDGNSTNNPDGREAGEGGMDDDGSGSGSRGSIGGGQRRGKPLPIGQRLLPNIFIESELGQADKHVLKNVTRVERFIQDVIRKTVEEEFVFPNFHTLVLP